MRNQLNEFLDTYDDDLWRPDPHEYLSVNFMNKPGVAHLFVWMVDGAIMMSEVEPPKLEPDAYDRDFAYFVKLPHPIDVAIG